jgi:hypothetical protein
LHCNYREVFKGGGHPPPYLFKQPAIIPSTIPLTPASRFPLRFPGIRRVNKHRYPIIRYQGVVNMVTEICNKFFDIEDETCEDRYL